MITFDKALIQEKNSWIKQVVLLKETPSTQQEAKNSEANILFLTSHQTATYGRFHRNYFAASEGGIYMSTNLGTIDSENPVQYTLLAASAVVSAIEKLTHKKPMIKWVNDIYLEGKKIVGILAESGLFGVVLGMGINFQIAEFPEEIAARAGSLFENDEKPTITSSDLVAEIWAEFHRLAKSDYMTIYKKHCFILGMTVQFEQNNVEYEGIAADLTEKGELLVKLNDESTMLLNSGEISLKGWI